VSEATVLNPIESQYTLVVLLAVRTLLAALFLYIYRRKRERYLLHWSVGWTRSGTIVRSSPSSAPSRTPGSAPPPRPP